MLLKISKNLKTEAHLSVESSVCVWGAQSLVMIQDRLSGAVRQYLNEFIASESSWVENLLNIKSSKSHPLLI